MLCTSQAPDRCFIFDHDAEPFFIYKTCRLFGTDKDYRKVKAMEEKEGNKDM